MISFLRGTIAEKGATYVIVDVGGVGYLCGVSTTTASALPAPGTGEQALVHTYMQVREDAVTLFGFATVEERSAFEHLIKVTGVGPKLAVSVLSTFTPAALREVVANGDERRMSTVPGVGKKTASRMILELRDALKVDLLPDGTARLPGMGESSSATAVDEASQALLSMGFSPQEVELSVKGYDGDPYDSEAAIKYALRRLGGNA